MIIRHQERIAKIERGIDPDAGVPRSELEMAICHRKVRGIQMRAESAGFAAQAARVRLRRKRSERSLGTIAAIVWKRSKVEIQRNVGRQRDNRDSFTVQ